SGLVGLEQFFLLIFARARFDMGRQTYTDFVCQKTQRFAEIKSFLLHDKGKDITAGTARTKTMPGLPFRKNVKRSRLFVVERAYGLKVTSGFGQFDVLPDDFHNV